MQSIPYAYHHDGKTLQATIAFDETHTKKRPGVLVFHDWSGRNAFASEQAKALANLGYVGFAADLYGDGQVGQTLEEKQALMTPLIENRSLLLGRILAAFQALKSLPQVDTDHIAAIGFCFGGLCALDLARSGENLSGVVSFHGLLNRDESTAIHPITAKLLVLHGYDDPMVPPEQVHTFCEEMTQAKADWQLHTYGQTSHAFTNPEANDPKLGTKYNSTSATHAFTAMEHFLKNLFKPVP